jgi:hypothetical protein
VRPETSIWHTPGCNSPEISIVAHDGADTATSGVRGAQAASAAIRLTALAEHLGERKVVADRREQPAAAGVEALLLRELARLRVVLQRALAVFCRRVASGEAVELRVGHAERGVDHAERLEDLLFEILVEPLA